MICKQVKDLSDLGAVAGQSDGEIDRRGTERRLDADLPREVHFVIGRVGEIGKGRKPLQNPDHGVLVDVAVLIDCAAVDGDGGDGADEILRFDGNGAAVLLDFFDCGDVFVDLHRCLLFDLLYLLRLVAVDLFDDLIDDVLRLCADFFVCIGGFFGDLVDGDLEDVVIVAVEDRGNGLFDVFIRAGEDVVQVLLHAPEVDAGNVDSADIVCKADQHFLLCLCPVLTDEGIVGDVVDQIVKCVFQGDDVVLADVKKIFDIRVDHDPNGRVFRLRCGNVLDVVPLGGIVLLFRDIGGKRDDRDGTEEHDNSEKHDQQDSGLLAEVFHTFTLLITIFSTKAHARALCVLLYRIYYSICFAIFQLFFKRKRPVCRFLNTFDKTGHGFLGILYGKTEKNRKFFHQLRLRRPRRKTKTSSMQITDSRSTTAITKRRSARQPSAPS